MKIECKRGFSGTGRGPSTLALLIALLIDGDGPGHHLFTGLYLHTRGPSTLALLIALLID